MKINELYKTKAFNFLSVVLVLISSVAYSQHIEQYTVNKINSEISLDGKLDENVWALAEATRDFVILGDNQNTAKSKAWAKILWDDNYLYVAFYCQDDKIWATYEDRDDPLYREDVVEVYIDPDADGKNYLEIEVNPLNTIFDLWLTKPYSSGGAAEIGWTMDGLNTAISADGTISDNADQDTAWICEMAMPFSEMKFAASSMNFPPMAGDKWRFNLYRFDRASTNDPNGEATGWSQTTGGQHEPDRFGVITFSDASTDIARSDYIPENFELYQNYPNPFNPTTQINFSLTRTGNINMSVYNMTGQHVKTLLDRPLSAGKHSANWDGRDKYGRAVANGTYFYRLQTAFGVKTMKMIMLK